MQGSRSHRTGHRLAQTHWSAAQIELQQVSYRVCHESGCHSLQLHITHGLHLPSCTAHTHSRPPLHQSHSCHHSLISHWLSHHTCTSFTHTHLSSTLTCTHCEVLFCYAIISERFFRVWFPVYDLDRLLDSESPLPTYCNHICPVYWLPRVFAASPDHKPELWLWFCLAYVVFEASVWTLPVWPPLCINKAAIGSNHTASALHSDCCPPLV